MRVSTVAIGASTTATKGGSIAVRVLTRDSPVVLGNLLHGKDSDGEGLEKVNTNQAVRLDMDVDGNLAWPARCGELEGDYLAVDQVGYLDRCSDNGSVLHISQHNPPVRSFLLGSISNAMYIWCMIHWGIGDRRWADLGTRRNPFRWT